jgi:hypothetical protein
MGVVAALGTALTHLPATDIATGARAGLNFEATRAMRTLLAGPSEWKILCLALRRVADAIEQLPGVTDAPVLASRLAVLSTTLTAAGATSGSGQRANLE